jgi:hypothetical protein
LNWRRLENGIDTCEQPEETRANSRNLENRVIEQRGKGDEQNRFFSKLREEPFQARLFVDEHADS